MKKIVPLFFITLFLVTAITCLAATDKEIRDVLKDLHWLGHDTFKIGGDIVVYLDPFRVKSPGTADIILITHPHHDHCSPDDVAKIQGPNTVIVAPADCGQKLSGKVRAISVGEKMSLPGAEIEAYPAYNVNKQYHTRDKKWVGYVVTIKGVRIYHAGDSDYMPEMRDLKNIDIALLPVSGTYVMTADEAVQAALAIKPKIAIPMHYGAIVGSKADAERFAAGLKGKVEVVILEQEQ